ncbi:MAG: hypothetical protein AAFY10_01095 [Pseudomonadota bacterium]
MILGRLQIALMGLAAPGLFWAGVQFEHVMESRERARLIAAADREIRTVRTERDQARDQVAKLNAATAEQVEALREALAEDRAASERARRANERAALLAVNQTETAAELSRQAQRMLNDAKDQCLGSAAGDEFLGLLDALANPGADAGDGRVPAGGSGP